MEFVLFALFTGYLIPWIAAVAREHERQAAVLAATLLLGWTGIGWLAALVYALRSDPHPRRPCPLQLIPGGGGGGATRPGA